MRLYPISKASAGYVSSGESVGWRFFFQTTPEYTAFLLGSLVVTATGTIALVTNDSLLLKRSEPSHCR